MDVENEMGDLTGEVTGGMLEEVADPSICMPSDRDEDVSHITDGPSIEGALNLAEGTTPGDYIEVGAGEDAVDLMSPSVTQDDHTVNVLNDDLPSPESGTLCLAMVQGTPVLVLANNPNNGTFEANVMIDNHSSLNNVLKVGDLHSVAQANLILQTQEKIAQEYCVVSPMSSVTNTKNTTQGSSGSQHKKDQSGKIMK